MPSPNHEIMQISHTSRTRLLFEKVAFRMLWRNAEHIRRKHYPLLCVLPHDVIGWEVMIHGFYEETLVSALAEKVLPHLGWRAADKIALDVGANIGSHTVFFSQHFKRVIAFEPNPLPAKILETNIFINELSNTQLERIGLGARKEIKTFAEIPGHLGGSGFQQHLLELSGVRKRELEVDLADSVMERLGIAATDIGLVKIDVEGMEEAVLKGMSRTLNEGNPVVLFETHGAAQAKPIMSALAEFGYDEFYVMEPRQIRYKPLKLLERLCFGMRYFLYKVDCLEDRFYPMVIAVKRR